jgi:hypothetical protein
MNPGSEPRFLTREAVDAIHEDQIDRFGGLHGVRDENALESAIAAAQNVYHCGNGDVYEVAAAYAFHLAESQAYFEGINEQVLKLRSCSSKGAASARAGCPSSRPTT